MGKQKSRDKDRDAQFNDQIVKRMPAMVREVNKHLNLAGLGFAAIGDGPSVYITNTQFKLRLEDTETEDTDEDGNFIREYKWNLINSHYDDNDDLISESLWHYDNEKEAAIGLIEAMVDEIKEKIREWREPDE